MNHAIWKYAASLLTGAAVSLLMTRFWGPRAPRWGFLDRPGGRKRHREPTPTAGGIAVFLGFHAACAVVFLPPWPPFAGQLPMGWWLRMIPLTAGAVAIGAWDDRYSMRPWVKFVAQFLLAVGAYLLNLRIQNVLGADLPEALDFAATAVWYVALMNAFNLIDGLDGLAAGIALIASAGVALTLVFRQAPGDVLLLLGFAGACAGFLRYNFYPARVFLGDTGSHFIGFTFAALALSTNSKGPALAALGAPLLAAGVPLFDTLLAVWRRSVRRWKDGAETAAVGRADADHLHHRLLRRCEGRQSRVALLLYGGTAALCGLGLLISVFNDRALGLLALAFLLGAYTIVRRLAWIELEDTGEALLQGMTRPVRRNRALLFYVAADIAILSGALWLTAALLGDGGLPIAGGSKKLWFMFAPTDIALPFIALLLFRSYTRVWYLARISEYASTGVAVAVGLAAAFAAQAIGWGEQASARRLLLRYLFLFGAAAPGITGIRAAHRIVEDYLARFHIGRRAGSSRGPRALICGAGYRTTLFLRTAHLPREGGARLRVIGIVAEDEAVKGHYVHGYRVLGSVRDLPVILREHAIESVHIVEDLAPENEALARDAVRAHGARLARWRFTEETLETGSRAVSETRPGTDGAASTTPANRAAD